MSLIIAACLQRLTAAQATSLFSYTCYDAVFNHFCQQGLLLLLLLPLSTRTVTWKAPIPFSPEIVFLTLIHGAWCLCEPWTEDVSPQAQSAILTRLCSGC